MNNKHTNLSKKDDQSNKYTEEYISKNYKTLLTLIITLSVLIRYLVGLYGYSGEGDKPKFGDFEAHRHWFEITNNLDVQTWYTDSDINPKEHWPIDYPPVCAYFHYLLGKVTKVFFPEAVMLKNWGYESPGFKIYMRLTVIVSELIFYYVPLVLILRLIRYKGDTQKTDLLAHLILILFNPAMVIIDHGHFQYNCVMLGFFLYAVYFTLKKWYYLTILFFLLSLNFKQMALYYSLVFFFYFIREILTETKGFTKVQATFHLLKRVILFGAFTITIQLLLWLPWRQNYNDVLTRIFPVWRGIFEDKVATFWCFTNIFYKLSSLRKEILILASTLLTLLFSVPSLGVLLIKNSKSRFFLAFFNVSLSFFMFSFHVHEKTILLPLLPALMCYNDLIEILPAFSLISSFSLYPLLQRENQVFTCHGLTIFYYFLSKYISERRMRNTGQRQAVLPFLAELVDMTLIITYYICENYIPPPKQFPWIYPLANAVLSFFNFMFFYYYSNWSLLKGFLVKKVGDKLKTN